MAKFIYLTALIAIISLYQVEAVFDGTLNRQVLIEWLGKSVTDYTINKIDIRRKNIMRIDPDTFRGLTKLNELHLEENAIEKLDPSLFTGLDSLTLIHLNSNSLTTIE